MYLILLSSLSYDYRDAKDIDTDCCVFSWVVDLPLKFGAFVDVNTPVGGQFVDDVALAVKFPFPRLPFLDLRASSEWLRWLGVRVQVFCGLRRQRRRR